VSKLIALSIIYGVPTQQLLRYTNPGAEQDLIVKPPPNFPDETILLPPDLGMSPSHFLRGIIGKRDLTLAPMVPAGSLVHIDTRDRIISMRTNWAQEFQRPIYFLTCTDGHICGVNWIRPRSG
jgi:hypothetical protein